ncbi:hypothetical protein D6C99_04745 [Aureobasidium pullulans]|nr:hypothetical protein D6C99_04745 [Aureobasidium pullulans]
MTHILDHPIYNPSPSDLRQPITATDLSVNPSTPHLDEYSISALFKMVAKIINLAMRGLQFVWALLIMSLIGNMIATSYSGNPSIVNYSMFVSVFSMLSLLYLIPASIKESFMIHPLLVVGLDVLNAIFYFCGAVAMSAYLGVHSCGNSSYTHSNSITNGSRDTNKRCTEAQASTAFLWFGFAAFCVSAVFAGLQGRNSGVNMRGGAGGIRKGPAMSQV